MRLVNADAVYKKLEKCELTATLGNPLSEYECGYCAGIDRAESELEDAETVEAVPIAFIQERIEEMRRLGSQYTCEMKIDGMRTCASIIASLLSLLDDWKERKEK